MVVVLDFGGQYNQLIARRVRECQVYCEVHPYTIGLFQSIPSLKEDVKRLKPIDGLMPDPMKLPSGCCFSTRCPYAEEKCRQVHPELVQAEGSATHRIRCLKWKNTAQ